MGSGLTCCLTFQSTPPRRGRPVSLLWTKLFISFQSTPPRRGRHGPAMVLPSSCGIAIHAPAQGATGSLAAGSAVAKSISIHAPAQGATRRNGRKPPFCSFQSTPPRRGRPGATVAAVTITDFNPRPRAGGDETGELGVMAGVFQSTPPRRGRRVRPYLCLAGTHNFNPRPRAGGDIYGDKNTTLLKPFQSTPPRRGRRCEG